MSDPQDPYAAPHETPPVDSGHAPTSDVRNLALIAHLSGCAGIVAGGLVGFVGPLIIYLMKKDTSPYVESQAKEALNFQITLFLISVVSVILTAVSCGALFPVIFVPMVLQVVFGIIAALAVRDGVEYRYPFNWRLIE
jgi:uncharacterized Tic20 family protein